MPAIKTAEKAIRDKKGRFLPGHKMAGPGRPKASGKTFMAMCKILLKEKDPETKKSAYYEIILKAIDQAKKGDPKAREWLANRADGKPVEEVHQFDFEPEKVKVIE